MPKLLYLDTVEFPPLTLSVRPDGFQEPWSIPSSVPMEKVFSSVVENLNFLGSSAKSIKWFLKEFSKNHFSLAVISDAFWFCLSNNFRPDRKREEFLFQRISNNYGKLLVALPFSRRSFFLRLFPDGLAQAVFFTLFLAYPKSRQIFNKNLRVKIFALILFWTSGLEGQFISTDHWKLLVGGNNIIDLVTNSNEGKSVKPVVRANRKKTLFRFSPLLSEFLAQQNYKASKIVGKIQLRITEGEKKIESSNEKSENQKREIQKQKENLIKLTTEFGRLENCLKKEEIQEIQNSHLEIEKLKAEQLSILQTDPHEYANLLISTLKLRHWNEGN